MDRMYQIYELYEELPQAIEHIKELQDKEKSFIQIFKDNGRYDEFDFMLKNMEDEIKNLDMQIEVFEKRYDILKEIVTDVEKNNKTSAIIRDTISKVFEAFGMTGEEPVEYKEAPEVPVDDTNTVQ